MSGTSPVGQNLMSHNPARAVQIHSEDRFARHLSYEPGKKRILLRRYWIALGALTGAQKGGFGRLSEKLRAAASFPGRV